MALLVAFHQVVRGAVQHGELRRKAVAAHAEAVWRCKELGSQRSREDCLAQLEAGSHDTRVTVVLISR